MTNVYRDPRVMVGNWSEDRAEPLEGVLVDYGYRSYNPTSGDAFPVPLRRLVDFERVTLQAGEAAEVHFRVSRASLALTGADGAPRVFDGEHRLTFSRGNGWDEVVRVTIAGGATGLQMQDRGSASSASSRSNLEPEPVTRRDATRDE